MLAETGTGGGRLVRAMPSTEPEAGNVAGTGFGRATWVKLPWLAGT